MPAASKHWADVNSWLYKVIDSCTTPTQVLNAKKLTRLYVKMYPGKKQECATSTPGDPMFVTHALLIDYCDAKFNKILTQKIEDEKTRSNCLDGDIN
jgi:hypothetical protein